MNKTNHVLLMGQDHPIRRPQASRIFSYRNQEAETIPSAVIYYLPPLLWALVLGTQRCVTDTGTACCTQAPRRRGLQRHTPPAPPRPAPRLHAAFSLVHACQSPTPIMGWGGVGWEEALTSFALCIFILSNISNRKKSPKNDKHWCTQHAQFSNLSNAAVLLISFSNMLLFIDYCSEMCPC